MLLYKFFCKTREGRKRSICGINLKRKGSQNVLALIKYKKTFVSGQNKHARISSKKDRQKARRYEWNMFVLARDDVMVAVVNSHLDWFKISRHVMPDSSKNLALGRPQVKS